MASQDWFDKDFYKVLGVSKDVSEAELKKIYRKLARQYHPDSNPGDAKAEAKFKEISEAHSVLVRPRAAQGVRPDPRHGLRRPLPGGRRGQGGGFEDVFGGMFGGGGGGRAGQQLQLHPARCRTASTTCSAGMLRPGRPEASAATADPRRAATSPRAPRIDFVTAIKGDTIKLQTADGRTDQGEDPGGCHRRAEDQAARQGRAESGRRRARRYRAHRDCAQTSRVRARRAEPARRTCR